MVKRLLVLGALVALAAMVMYGVASARHGVLVTQMTGANEVSSEGDPGAGDEDGTGKARIRMFPDRDEICFRVAWKNIGAPTASHIHEGEAGSNGGVVVTLFSQESPLPETIRGVTGCASGVTDDQAREIRDNPAGFYVNVHNSDFPGGAIRGQLRHPRK